MSRGFGTTLGAGASDRILTTYQTDDNLSSTMILSNRNAGGGGGGAGFGAMWDKRAGAIVETFLNRGDLGWYEYTHSFSTTQGRWSVAQPSTNVWVNYIVTYDNQSTSNAPVVYVNGSSVTVTLVVAPVGTPNVVATPICLGNRNTDGLRNWDGMLAEYARWNVILTAQEAAALGQGISPLVVRPRNLVSYVPMLRDNVDLCRSPPTLTGTAVTTHPRFFRPKRP